MTADHRSIYPNLPGLPWWAAVVVAATTATLGIAFDAGSGNKELTNVFGALYVLGCLAAVLAVRQSGLFTAVIQPPLILFCAVPGAYWLFHGAGFTDIKGLLINCGYPLIERFPLMLFTTAGVLLIGMARWYFGMAGTAGMAARPATPKTGEPGPVASTVKKLATKLTAALTRDPAAATASRQRRVADRPRRSTAAPRGSGSARQAVPAGSRHGRPPGDEAPDPRARRRPAPPRDERPPRRRRPGPPQDVTRRGRPAEEARRDPRPRPGRPTAPSGRPVEPPEPPPRRRQAPQAANGDPGATHHPISRVRYRRPDPGDESGAEPQVQSPAQRRADAESWEYDI